MNRKEIWAFAEKHKIGERRVYRRFLKLKSSDFEVIKPFLKEARHPGNHYEVNYRSPQLWHHFHATKEGSDYEIHNDIINPNRYTFFTLIPHSVLEGGPYLICKAFAMLFARDQLSIKEKSWFRGIVEKNFRKN